MTAVENRNLDSWPHVLIVDDDDRIRTLVSRFLRENGFVAMTAASAGEARQIMKSFLFDVLVVDIMMPGESGLDFTKSIRADRDMPVLLLTARGETADRIEGLESGADDYLPKPFEPRELVLRLQSLLRRRPPLVPSGAASIKTGPWSYDAVQKDLVDVQSDRRVRLTGAEAVLFEALAARGGAAVSREDLALLCGLDIESARTVDVQVTRLRRKLEDDPRQPRLLQTVRGRGYRLLTEAG